MDQSKADAPVIEQPRIGLYFKAINDGFVCRPPKPHFYAPAEHFFVTQKQRDEMLSILASPESASGRLTPYGLLFLCTVLGILLITAIVYPISERANVGVAVLAGAVLIVPSVLGGIIMFADAQARRCLRRLQPVLASATHTDMTITNAELIEVARQARNTQGTFTTAFLLSMAFGIFTLVQILSLSFGRSQTVPFFSDPKIILPLIQIALFAGLTAQFLYTAWNRIPASVTPSATENAGKSCLLRNPRRLIGFSAAALVILACISGAAVVRNEVSDYSRGKRHEATGEHDLAIESFSKAIQHSPNDIAAYRNRAEVYANKGQADLAIADYAKILMIDPSDAGIYVTKGQLLAGKADHIAAIADYGRAIELNPKTSNANFWRGVSRAATGDNDGAISDFSTALALKPGDVYSLISRGRSYGTKGDKQKALADFNAAIETEEVESASKSKATYSYARYWRGLLLLATGDNDGALADFNKGIQQHPGNTNLMIARANTYEAKGERAQALADLRKVLELEPKNAASLRRLTQLGGGAPPPPK